MTRPGRPPRRLPCPVCGDPLDKVTDSRPVEGGVRRRRLCLNGHRVVTMEQIVVEQPAA